MRPRFLERGTRADTATQGQGCRDGWSGGSGSGSGEADERQGLGSISPKSSLYARAVHRLFRRSGI